MDVLNYEVTTEDHFPPFVCIDCSDKLYEFKAFKVKCDSLRETYKLQLDSGSTIEDEVKGGFPIAEKSAEDTAMLEGNIGEINCDDDPSGTIKIEIEESELPITNEFFPEIVRTFPIKAESVAESPEMEETEEIEKQKDSKEEERSLRCRKMVNYKLLQEDSEVSDVESSDSFCPDMDDVDSSCSNNSLRENLKRRKPKVNAVNVGLRVNNLRKDSSIEKIGPVMVIASREETAADDRAVVDRNNAVSVISAAIEGSPASIACSTFQPQGANSFSEEPQRVCLKSVYCKSDLVLRMSVDPGCSSSSNQIQVEDGRELTQHSKQYLNHDIREEQTVSDAIGEKLVRNSPLKSLTLNDIPKTPVTPKMGKDSQLQNDSFFHESASISKPSSVSLGDFSEKEGLKSNLEIASATSREEECNSSRALSVETSSAHPTNEEELERAGNVLKRSRVKGGIHTDVGDQLLSKTGTDVQGDHKLLKFDAGKEKQESRSADLGRECSLDSPVTAQLSGVKMIHGDTEEIRSRVMEPLEVEARSSLVRESEDGKITENSPPDGFGTTFVPSEGFSNSQSYESTSIAVLTQFGSVNNHPRMAEREQPQEGTPINHTDSVQVLQGAELPVDSTGNQVHSGMPHLSDDHGLSHVFENSLEGSRGRPEQIPSSPAKDTIAGIEKRFADIQNGNNSWSGDASRPDQSTNMDSSKTICCSDHLRFSQECSERVFLKVAANAGEISCTLPSVFNPGNALSSSGIMNEGVLERSEQSRASNEDKTSLSMESRDGNGQVNLVPEQGWQDGPEVRSVSTDSSSSSEEESVDTEIGLDDQDPKKEFTSERLCEFCGKVYFSSGSLISHKIMAHFQDKKFKCLECPKAFTMKHHLIQHMSMHGESRPFSCKECGKAFKLKTHLKQHAVVHSKKHTYQCQHCELGFRRKWQHDKHQKSHEGKVVWQCSACGKELKTWVEYGEHLLDHRKNQTYCCDICSKEYKFKASLRRHIYNHIKPHQCSVCHKYFGTKKFLRCHMRTHTGEKPYACKICGKLFSRHAGRLAHMVTHSDAKPFKCQFCDFRTKYKSELKVHMRRKHSQTNL